VAERFIGDMVIVSGELAVEHVGSEHNGIYIDDEVLEVDDLLALANFPSEEVPMSEGPLGYARTKFGRVRITIERMD